MCYNTAMTDEYIIMSRPKWQSELIQLLKQGQPYLKSCKAVGISVSAARKAGITKKNFFHPVKEPSKALLKVAKDMHKEGKTRQEIHQETGIASGLLRSRRLGSPRRRRAFYLHERKARVEAVDAYIKKHGCSKVEGFRHVKTTHAQYELDIEIISEQDPSWALARLAG